MALTLAIHCPTSVRKENEAFLIKGVDTFLCTRPFGRCNPTKNKTVRDNPKRTISYTGWSGLLHSVSQISLGLARSCSSGNLASLVHSGLASAVSCCVFSPGNLARDIQ